MKLELSTSKILDGARDTVAPEIVTAGPPARRDMRAISKPVRVAVKIWPPIVTISQTDVGCDDRTVELPNTNTPDVAKEIGVPETMLPCQLGRKDVPAI